MVERQSVDALAHTDNFYDNLIRSLISADLRNFDLAKTTFDQYITSTDPKINDDFEKIGKNLIQCYVYRLSYEYEKLENLSYQCILDSEKISDDILLALSICENVRIFIIRNDIDAAKNKLTQVLPKIEGSSKFILFTRWKILNLIAEILTNNGYQEESLRHMHEVVDISKKLGIPTYISRSLNNLGITYDYSGLYPKAIESYTESLKISVANNAPALEAVTRGNMGFINMYQGNWYDALDKFTKTMEYFESCKDIRRSLYWKNNIAKLYLDKGEYLSAKTLLEENIALLQFYDLQNEIVYPYLDHFLVSYQLKSEDDLNETFEIIRDLSSRNPHNETLEHYSLLCSAILIKKSFSNHNPHSEEILDFLIDDDEVEIEVAILAVIIRCELFLDELHANEDETDEIITNILQLISHLEELCMKNHLYPLLVLSKILSSQFLVITGQFQISLDVLNAAISICLDNGLNGLLNEGNKQKEQIEKEILNIYERISTQSSVKERFLELDFNTYLERIKNFRLFR